MVGVANTAWPPAAAGTPTPLGWPDDAAALATFATSLSRMVLQGTTRRRVVDAVLGHLRREFAAPLSFLRVTDPSGRHDFVTNGAVEATFGPLLLAQVPRAGAPAVVAVCRAFGAPPVSGDEQRRFVVRAACLGAAIDGLVRAEGESRRARAEGRARVAEDLHDSAIQEIYGASLVLTRVLETGPEPATAAGIADAVAAMDRAISAIRLAVFDLTSPADDRSQSAAGRIERLAGDVGRSLGFTPSVFISGPLDDLPSNVEANLLMVLKECLSNVARHSQATKAAIDVSVGATDLTLVVRDNGLGFGAGGDGNGLSNMRRRAQRLDGACTVRSLPQGGVFVRWRVPLRTATE